MRGYASWLGLTALVFGAGCAAGESERTGTIEVGAVAAPLIDSRAVAEAAASPVHIELAIQEVLVHIAPLDDPAGDVEERYEGSADPDIEAEDEDGLWLTLPGMRSLDLRPGANMIALGAAAAPAGKITQIRLRLAGDAILWDGPKSTIVACPSCTTSGLKLRVGEDVLVTANRTTTIKLLFDLSLSDLATGETLKLGPIAHVEASVEP